MCVCVCVCVCERDLSAIAVQAYCHLIGFAAGPYLVHASPYYIVSITRLLYVLIFSNFDPVLHVYEDRTLSLPFSTTNFLLSPTSSY